MVVWWIDASSYCDFCVVLLSTLKLWFLVEYVQYEVQYLTLPFYHKDVLMVNKTSTYALINTAMSLILPTYVYCTVEPNTMCTVCIMTEVIPAYVGFKT